MRKFKKRLLLCLVTALLAVTCFGTVFSAHADNTVTLTQSQIVDGIRLNSGNAVTFDYGTYATYYGVPGSGDLIKMPYNEVGNGSFVWNGDNANAYVKTNAFQVNFVHEKGYKKSEQAWTMFAKSHKMAIIGFDISKDCNINIHHDGGFVNPDYNLHGYLYYLVERNGVIMLAAQKETNQLTVEENAFAHSFNVLKGDKVYIAFTSKNEYSCAYNIELKFDFSDPVAGKDLERNVNGLSLNDIVSQGKGYSVLLHMQL